MKITFEGPDILNIQEQIDAFQDQLYGTMGDVLKPPPEKPVVAVKPKSKGGRPKGYKVKSKAKPVEKTVEKPVEKPVREPVEKSAMPLSAMQDEEAMRVEKFEDMVLEPDLTDAPEPVVDAAKLAAIRVKTTEDLQAAYSSGKHKAVLDLLATYGNGAKSFRELTIKDFLPIRKAIDDGALN